MKRASAYRIAALALLACLLATNAYRAATQSITIDEAFTYHKHIAGPRFWMFDVHTANNHVLNTLAAKLTTSVFGLSEWSLRLPSLAGGLLYFAAVFRLGTMLFGASPWLVLFVAGVSLNPGLLDFLSAARGYGMGLGFLMWAMVYMLESRAVMTGMALGLAVASQLTYAPPAAAVGIVFAVRDYRKTLAVAAPALLTAAAILAWPMRHARLADFYVGQASFLDTLRSLAEISHYYKWTALHSARWVAHVFLNHPAVVLTVAVGAACAATAVSVRRKRRLSNADREFLACLGVGAASVALLYAARIFVARPFPADRTGLYFYPLVWLACLLPFRQLSSRTVKAAAAGVACLYITQYALQLNTSYYYVYRADAGVKAIVHRIRAGRAERPRDVKVGASWELSDSLNFYRLMHGAAWMPPVTREGPDCYFDYYVLMAKDRGWMERYDLEERYRDPVTGATLAEPRDTALRRLAAVFPPPLQTAPPCRVDPSGLGPYARMSDPQAESHIVQDILPGPSDGPRWTYQHPILLFRPGGARSMRFRMRLRLTQELFPPGSGPLEIAVLVNNRLLARPLFPAPGEHDFEAPVAASYFGRYALAAVEIRSSRHFTPPRDTAVLGYQLVEAGFTL